MSFSDGHCVANRDPVKTRINLYFPNALTFNGMVDGTKNPIPTRGLTKIRFMTKTFKSLTDRLTYYLKPTEESLKDQETRYSSIMLTCYTVFYALSEIGNTDPQGIACRDRMEDGVIQVSVPGELEIHIIKENGRLRTEKGRHASPKAFMEFSDLETIEGILRGTLDSFAAIGSGKLRIKGRIPMIDNLNKILFLVARYLS